jgi:uncharacterized protein (TIGR02246 family)
MIGMAATTLAVQPAWAHPASTHPAKADATAAEADAAAIKSVLAQYQSALERLDLHGTEKLFAKDSAIFEGGGSEGNYAHYLAHHLTPELGEFKSFKYGNYKVDVRLLGPAAALATETYTYRIETKKGEVAERLGVATSVLKKDNGRWKILMSHNSARRPSAS